MMEFWAVEVKYGGTLKVQPGEGKLLHVSQACLGEVKKNQEDYIRLYVQKNDKKFVMGMLSPDRAPHLNLDLVFEDEFELSHDLKQGSVHFAGYYVNDSNSLDDEDESDDDLDEPVPVDTLITGKPDAIDSKPSGSKTHASVKLEKAEGKSKVKIVEPSKYSKKNVEDDETEDDDEDASDESDEDEEMASSDAGSDDDEEDSDEEEEIDEETPKKPETSKKRPAESISKTPVREKKAKFSTPQQKTEGKKVVHVATPHPAKQIGKTPANADKSNKQTPSKSFTCPSCSKSFGSEQAVQSHSKAKHSGN